MEKTITSKMKQKIHKPLTGLLITENQTNRPNITFYIQKTENGAIRSLLHDMEASEFDQLRGFSWHVFM